MASGGGPLYARRNEVINCCILIETLEFMIKLYLDYDKPVEKGYIVHGVAWLFGDMELEEEQIQKIDLELAHCFSGNHKPELEKDRKCGCFNCLTIFTPSEIDEWIIADNMCDKRGTAICPYCGIDSVIGESSGFPITKDFLRKMKKRWF